MKTFSQYLEEANSKYIVSKNPSDKKWYVMGHVGNNNWMPVSALPRNITCVDPIALEAKMIIDASGHDSVAVKRLVDRNMVEWKGMNPMWVENGEEHVVEKTSEVFPGLVIAGMSVTETHGLARMGPTFGSMLYSGKRAAEITDEKIKEYDRKIPKKSD